MPHLVLPLSGCLSRHTPTRATRGEARGHRSALAQNPLLIYPLRFLPLGLSSVWCVVSRWWAGPHVFALLWFHPCWVSFDRVTWWTCGSPKGTQRDCFGCVCCLCIASRCGCRPVSGMSTPSRSRVLVHNRVPIVSRPFWFNGSARLRVSIAVVVPQWLPQRVGEVRGMWERLGGTCWCMCVVAVMGLCDRRFGTSWRHPIDT